MIIKRIVPILRHPRHSIKMLIEERRKRNQVSSRATNAFGSNRELKRFQRSFVKNLKQCTWRPHDKYSVFTQYDQSFYLEHKEKFLHKYKCFYAVSKTVAPRRIIELGTHSGASADAYISASPEAEYIGFDWYDSPWWEAVRHEDTGERWYPYPVLQELFRERGFTHYKVYDVDLRALKELPCQADFVVVDAAHDFENEYADLKLALTAEPEWIFVDDVVDEAADAVEKFLSEDLAGRVDYLYPIDYIGGGLVIKLRKELA